MQSISCPTCQFMNPSPLLHCVQCGAVLPKSGLAEKMLRRLFSGWFEAKKAVQPIQTVEAIDKMPAHLETEGGTRYILQKQLGRGGFCTVYWARKEGDKTDYALKLFRLWEVDPASRADRQTRFLLEFGIGQQPSEYLVTTYEKGTYRGNPFFVMDYCEGGTLADRIGNDWPDHRLKAIAVEILRGVQQLHESGIIHRDLKPSNIVFRQNQPKLIDFGISGRLDMRLTRSHDTLGTDVYMAPELFQYSAKQYTSKLPTIDVYSFGVLLFELLTKGLFPHGNPPDASQPDTYHLQLADYSRRVKAEEWTNLTQLRQSDQLSAFWADLITDCLRANPTQRIQSIRALLDRLGQVEPLLYCLRCNHEQPTHRTARCLRCGEPLLTRMLGLRVMVGQEAGLFHDLSTSIASRGLATLGRYSDFELVENDVPVQEFNEQQPYISRYHATIEHSLRTGEWYIRDGQWRPDDDAVYAWNPSRNGVFVNATRADINGLAIFPDDIITIGEVTLKVELCP